MPPRTIVTTAMPLRYSRFLVVSALPATALAPPASSSASAALKLLSASGVLILFSTPEALKSFKAAEAELEAGGASAVAGNAETTKNLEYRKGIAVVTMVRGGMTAEASVGGQKGG